MDVSDQLVAAASGGDIQQVSQLLENANIDIERISEKVLLHISFHISHIFHLKSYVGRRHASCFSSF